MAQQRAISTRELQDVGAANRRGPSVSSGGFTPSESTQNKLQFAKDLGDFEVLWNKVTGEEQLKKKLGKQLKK